MVTLSSLPRYSGAKMYLATLTTREALEEYFRERPVFKGVGERTLNAWSDGGIALIWRGYDPGDEPRMGIEHKDTALEVYGVDLITRIEFDMMVAAKTPINFSRA